MNGWVITAGVITAYDIYQLHKDGETMSACWLRWIAKPPGRIACAMAWGFLTVHLFGGNRWIRSWQQSITTPTTV